MRSNASTPTASTSRACPRPADVTPGRGFGEPDYGSSGDPSPRRSPSSRGNSSPSNYGDDYDGGSSGGGGGGDAAIQTLFWVIMIAAAVFLLFALISRARRAAPSGLVPNESQAEEAEGPSAAELAIPRSAAQRLADAGNYGDAVHTLLLETLALLSARVPGGLAKALTSREILARVPLPSGGREPLQALVAQVESTLFAGREPSAGDWEAAEAEFERFTQACARGRA